MALPSVYSLSTGRSSLTAFGGLNESYACAEAEFTRMQNFSSRGYPALQTRTPRRKMEAVEHCNGMYHLNGMLLCEGTTLRYKADHEETLATTAAEEEIVLKNAVSDSEKIMVGMGTKIILFPDKAAFDTKTGSLTPLGAGWESAGTVTLTPCDAAGRTYTATGHAAKEPDNPTDGQVFLKVINSQVPYSSESVLEVYNETLGSWSAVELNYCKIEATGIGKDFAVWDTVTISGIGANEDGYWKELTGDRVVYAQGDDFVQVKAEPGGDYFYGTLTKEGDCLRWRSIDGKGSGLEGSLELFRVERRVPDLDFLTECDNRVWGCSSRENVIYGCKLGDPTNWFSYRGTAADSYAVTVGSDGEFTGAATCMGYALFFKENTLHKLYGSRPADFRLVSVQCRGVAKYASRSLCVIAEVLYYLSNDGVMAWDGSLPVKISGVLDSTWLMNVRGAVGGVLDTRYYLHMRQPSTGETRLLVYDTERQLWHEEDVAGDSEAEGWAMCSTGRQLYQWDGASLWATEPNREADRDTDEAKAALEKNVAFDAVTGDIGLNTPADKYVSRVTLRVDALSYSVVKLQASYDGGAWETLGEAAVLNKYTRVNLPFGPTRHDTMRLRLTGTGQIAVRSVAFTMADSRGNRVAGGEPRN